MGSILAEAESGYQKEKKYVIDGDFEGIGNIEIDPELSGRYQKSRDDNQHFVLFNFFL